MATNQLWSTKTYQGSPASSGYNSLATNRPWSTTTYQGGPAGSGINTAGTNQPWSTKTYQGGSTGSGSNTSATTTSQEGPAKASYDPTNTRNPLGNRTFSGYSLTPSGSQVVRNGDVSDPEVFASNYLRPGLNAAQSYFNQGAGFNPYEGQRVAEFSGLQNKALDQTNQYMGSQPGYLNQAQKTVKDMAGGGATNPYFQDSLDQQLDDIQNRVNASTSGMGRYGSGAHTSVLASEMSDAATRALNENYFGEQQLKLGAAGMAPQMLAAEQSRLNALMQAGGLQQAQRQQELGAARDLYEETEQAPIDRLNWYMGSIGQPNSGSNPNMPEYPEQQEPGWAQRGLGGALVGGSIGGMFGMPGLGAAAGGIAGLFG